MITCEHSPTVRLFAAMNDDCPVCLRSQLAHLDGDRAFIVSIVARAEKAEARLAEIQDDAKQKDIDWLRVCQAFGFRGHADPEELIAKAKRLAEAEAQLQCDPDATICRLKERLAEAEALIDALMLEFCPDEMTDDQKARWAAHQQPSDDAFLNRTVPDSTKAGMSDEL